MVQLGVTLPFVLALTVTAIVSGLICIGSWRAHGRPGAVPLALAAAGVALFAAGYAAELVNSDPVLMLFWVRVQYIGIVVIPVAWLWLSLEYTGREHWFLAPQRYLLAIVPLVTLLLVWTNDQHGLIWQQTGLKQRGPITVFDPQYGAWFWVHTIFSYTAILLGSALLLRAVLRSHRLFRRQSLVLLLAMAAPLLGNALYLAEIGPGVYFDLTPLAFGFSVLLIAAAAGPVRLLEVSPLARDMIFAQLGDPVIVLDTQGRIVDLNIAGSRALQMAPGELIGQRLREIIPQHAELLDHYRESLDVEEELSITRDDAQHFLELRIFPLYGWGKHLKGRLVLLRDITARKRQEALLRVQNAELAALHQTALALIEENDTNRVLTTIVQRAAELVDAHDGYIAVRNTAGDAMVVQVGVGVFAPTVGMRIAMDAGLVGRVWASGQQLLVDNYAQWPQRLLHDPTVGAMIGLPLTGQAGVIGVIGLCYLEPERSFGADVQARIDRFARLAALALENTRLYEALRQEVIERRTTEHFLALARDAAEAANRAKSAFLANMTHDLRTPLTTILGNTQLMQHQLARGDLSQFNEELASIVAAANHQISLVNNLLDLAKIEAGRMELAPTEFTMEDLVAEVGYVIRPLAERGGNTFSVDLAPDVGRIRADRFKLRQVLMNLLSNATKFTEHGQIVLQVRRISDPDGDRLQITVSDTGIGIPAAAVARIFEEFTQLASPPEQHRVYGGTGLGLAICKRYVDLMGGTISVVSEAGAGAAFAVELPAYDRVQAVNASPRTILPNMQN